MSAQGQRLLFVFPLAAVIAAVLFHSSAFAVHVMVRPMTTEGAELVDELRTRLGVTGGAGRLATIGAWFWNSPRSASEAEVTLASYRSRGIASEIIPSESPLMVWPVSESQLTLGARANYDRVASLRTYASRKGVVKMIAPPFSGRMLRQGLPMAPESPVGGFLKWQLFKDVTIGSTRVGLKSGRGGMFAWVGELDRNPLVRVRYGGGMGAATYYNGHSYARFEHGDDHAIYQLIPLGDQFHLVLKVDPSKVPESEPQYEAKRDQKHDPSKAENDAPAPGSCAPGEGDRPIADDGGVGEGDRPIADDGGVGEGDRPGAGDSGVGEGDVKDLFYGFCPDGSCVPALTVRGESCFEGPRTCANIRIGVGFTGEEFGLLPAIADDGTAAWPSTPSLRNARHLAQYLVDLTSISFSRSGVHARVHLGAVRMFGALEVENKDPKVMVDRLAWVPTPLLGGSIGQLTPMPPNFPPSAMEVRAWRNKTASDVVMILSSNGRIPGLGEFAGWSPSKSRVRDSESAYSIVVGKYADAQLSFLHELGHHLGAYHDPAAGTGAPPFDYARGFREGCKWRTVMAYDGSGSCRPKGVPRLLMWSSCNLVYRGVLVGGPTQNNVLIINNMSGWVAGFRY